MESKLLNHVEFKFIRNAYPLHEKLFCYFQGPSVSQWQPEIGDWVGLYKVGWSTLKEHKVRKSIQQEWLENRKNVNVDYVHVVFEQHELPKEIEGSYQFVYVTKMDVVKGISTPFRFERVVPQVELRRVVADVYGKQQEQEIQLPRLSSEREQIMGRIENELIKECQRLNLNWNRIQDDSIVNGKLMQKFLNNIKLVQNDDITKKVEELFVENGKLCMSLKTRIQEVAELKRECDDIKTVNGDLLNKLVNAERKVEQLEREKDLNVRRIEEITRDLPRVTLEELQLKKFQDLDEVTSKWLLQENEQTTVQPSELKRVSSYNYGGELETTTTLPIDARIKVVQRVALPVEQQQEQTTIVLPQQQQQQTVRDQRRSHLVEKLLREVDGTPSQVRLLKRVIEDLKTDNEVLRERVRQVENGVETTMPSSFIRQQQVQLPVKQCIAKETVTVCPRIGLVPMSELVGEQRMHHHQQQQQQQQQQQHHHHHSLPTMVESTLNGLPSISVSTILPEQQKSTITISGKVEQPRQQWQQLVEPRQWQSIEQQKQWQQVEPKQWQSMEQQKQWQQGEPRQWQSMEQQKQWQQVEQQKQWQQGEPRQWQSINETTTRPQQWEQQIEQQQEQFPLFRKQWKQVEQQQQSRGQLGDYFNRLDEQIRNKIEERLRNKLQEQLQGKIEQQQQQRSSPLYEVLKQQQQQQIQKQQQPWSSQLNEVLIPRQWQSMQQQQQQQQVEEQIRKLCPVCGIVMPSELNVCDFEIHVNSHFTD